MGRRMRRAGFAARLLLCSGAVLLVGLLAAGPAAAAPPANDNFAAAQAISGPNATVSGTNVDATKQAGEPNHAGDQGGASVWYSWTVPSTATIKLDTCVSGLDTLLAVYTGASVSSLSEVASNDQSACGNQSKLNFHAVIGTTYMIAVDGWSEFGDLPPDEGTFQLSLAVAPPPANDNFASAEEIPLQTENDVPGTNVAATKQANEPNHAGDPGGASVWYRWTAPLTGKVRFNTCDTEIETLLAVYTGSSVGSLQPVAADRGTCGFGSEVTFATVTGTQYMIAVDGPSDGGAHAAEQGDFVLSSHGLSTPFNDDFAKPRMLGGFNPLVAGTNIDATAESGEPSGFLGGPLYSVWYVWTAPVSGQLAVDTCNSNFDTVLTVFSGGALNTLTRLASNDDAPSCIPGSKLILNVQGGTAYRIAVDGYFEQGNFDLRLALVPGAVLDSQPPQSKIKKVIVDSEHHKAKIKFGSSEPGASFRCKLDHKTWYPCHSPKTYRHLDVGKHKVKVQARDAAGNLDPTAAVRRFHVEP